MWITTWHKISKVVIPSANLSAKYVPQWIMGLTHQSASILRFANWKLRVNFLLQQSTLQAVSHIYWQQEILLGSVQEQIVYPRRSTAKANRVLLIYVDFVHVLVSFQLYQFFNLNDFSTAFLRKEKQKKCSCYGR